MPNDCSPKIIAAASGNKYIEYESGRDEKPRSTMKLLDQIYSM